MNIAEHRRFLTPLLGLSLLVLSLAGCGLAAEETIYGKREGGEVVRQRDGERETIFGPGGIDLFGNKKQEPGGGGGAGSTGIGVNSYLWRATLDTIAFMPLSSADPFGGVIITDWYSPPETPQERFKINVFILDRRLRSDGIKVAVFRQQRTSRGDWSDQNVSPGTTTDLENAILTRARQLRLNTVEN